MDSKGQILHFYNFKKMWVYAYLCIPLKKRPVSYQGCWKSGQYNFTYLGYINYKINK